MEVFEVDEIRREEENKLTEVENKLSVIASKYETKVKQLNDEIQNSDCYDYEDIDRRRYTICARESALKEFEQFKGYQDSPYFARMEFENSEFDECFEIFVGKQGISDGANQIVVDWRSPIGQTYYAHNQKQFNINKNQYMLLLKRAMDIQKGKLISYNTEYDGTIVNLEGDVIDSFLLTVLKDKRRQTRLTDIIRTIQQNQNEIIHRPIEESFIVQGCAGSGKTMILLHRLSYLLFNNRNISISGIKIITPNKYFDAYINDLSNELGLTSIKRYSVEEYYVDLIHRYSGKIDVLTEVHSEKRLNTELLSYVYSSQFISDSILQYNEYWNHVIQELQEIKLEKLFVMFNQVYPDTSVHTSDTYLKLDSSIKRITTIIDEFNKRKSEMITRAEIIGKQIAENKKKYSSVYQKLEIARNNVIIRINQDLEVLENTMKEISLSLHSYKNNLKTLEYEFNQNNKDIERTDKIIQRISQSDKKYSNYEFFITYSDEVSDIIRENFSEQISLINDSEKLLKKTPAYNFGKRNSLRKSLDSLKKNFNEDVAFFLEKLLSYYQNKRNECSDKRNKLNSQSAILSESIESEKKRKNLCEARYHSINECRLLFASTELPDTNFSLSKNSRKDCLDIISDYEQQRESAEKLDQNIQELTKRLESIHDIPDPFKISELNDEDVKYINVCSKIVSRLQMGEIFLRVMFKNLFAKYKQYQQTYYKTNYRHKLYIRLLYCSLYYTSLRQKDTFINIDEAQDISKSEYSLLKYIHGSKCIFNLYGDINQLVYNFKGISDWEEISGTISSKVYVLNENYRNTAQITEFCNHEFGAEVVPIGISGYNVIEMTTALAVEWLKKVKTQFSSYRTAIIFRYGVKEIQDVLHELLKDEDVSWSIVDSSKISVISVEAAKGLEFEAVVAIVSQMTNNEKYVTFTRALSNLVVVRDNYSAELSDENIEVMSESEFTESITHEADSDDANNSEQGIVIETPDNSIINNASNDIDLDDQRNDLSISHTEIRDVVLSQEDKILINEFNNILHTKFDANHSLDDIQQKIVCLLYNRNNVACCAPSGYMKTVMFYLLANKAHKENKKQSILTSEAYLQENELVLAERLGLRGGYIDGNMEAFSEDFQKDKYDVIFVSYSFFEKPENLKKFAEYFRGKISYWGIDHPQKHKDIWKSIINLNSKVQSAMFAMTKEEFGEIDLSGFEYYTTKNDMDTSIIRKVGLTDPNERITWLVQNRDRLKGQGIIYCNDESECKLICKKLRKCKIMAESYIDVTNPDKKERINYLTNSYVSGTLSILVTTHEVGLYLSNPKIRFIVHYDMPNDNIYHLHISQIGKLANNPEIIDLLY